MKFGLMIIGDEIVQGTRADAHFPAIKQLLAERGLRLAWVEYVCDDRAELVKRLKRSFAESLPVLVTGGIGATPDDHTRQAVAEALDLPMALASSYSLAIALLKAKPSIALVTSAMARCAARVRSGSASPSGDSSARRQTRPRNFDAASAPAACPCPRSSAG